MYLVSLMVEDINRNVGNEIVSNVGKVVEIKRTITRKSKSQL